MAPHLLEDDPPQKGMIQWIQSATRHVATYWKSAHWTLQRSRAMQTSIDMFQLGFRRQEIAVEFLLGYVLF